MFELDEENYPRPSQIEFIKTYHGSALDFFRGLKDGWAHPSFGYEEVKGKDVFRKPVARFFLSTGGWSGNEETIGAMEENLFLWMFTWKESRRGGHYVFEFDSNLKIPERKK